MKGEVDCQSIVSVRASVAWFDWILGCFILVLLENTEVFLKLTDYNCL